MYGDANPVFTGTLTGVQNGENITASYASNADASTPIGNYPIIPTLQDPDNKLSNYDVTINNGTLSVTKAPLTVNVANATRLYGSANPVFSGNITGARNNDILVPAYSTTATPGSNVGQYPITANFTDPESRAANYNVTVNNGILTVIQAELTITPNDFTRGVGSPNPLFTGTVVGLQNGDDISATYSTDATQSSPIGFYAIIPSTVDPQGKLGNYSLSIDIGTLTIRAAGVTAIAWLENGHAHITGAGDAGVNYSIEASSDLTTWSPIATVTADQNGMLEFEDSDASQFPNRFYRAVLSQ
jgi:hypothetical protein